MELHLSRPRKPSKKAGPPLSRIRHRQFGVLVTTSAIARQAYEEVRQDRHPIIFISGRDISEILFKNEFNTEAKVETLLKTQYPV
jgi:hypothetical protein